MLIAVLISLPFLSLVHSQVDQCPYGFMKHGASCYLFSTLRVSWIQAIKLCELYGAELAVIESQAEEQYVQQYLKTTWNHANQTDGIWLGGTDLLVENEWIWAISGDPIEYTPWAPGEPNHSPRPGNDESCLDLLPHKNFMWNDESCEAYMNFLCESSLVTEKPIVIG